MGRAPFWATLALALWTCGCQAIRVPAIDPSGERIFLPLDQSTTINPPQFSHDWSNVQPAFKRPDKPPPESVLTGPPAGLPCDRPPTTNPCGPQCAPEKKCFLHGWFDKSASVARSDQIRHQLHRFGRREPVVPRGKPGQIMLSPTRIVAPVGTEVVLVSGVCGDDGYLVTKQPIEWLLSQESVGHFVEVGEPARRHFTALQSLQTREGGKLGVDYALTKTTSKSQMITRGTPSQADDLLLQRGQTWVSVTSANEGSSFVTTLALDRDRWDQRRQTATIHWVDAKAAFPPPAILRVGQRHELVTMVVRASDGLPAEDWIVRYTIEGGPAARFVESGQSVAETRTDSTGAGRATIEAPAMQTGSNQVRIEVIRPPRGSQPRLPLNSSTTTVEWTAPGLAVRCVGPGSVAEGSVASYRIEVSNPGNMAAEDVALVVEIPPALELVNANPPAHETWGPQKLRWLLGSVAGGSGTAVQVNCRAKFAGDVRIRSTATGNPSLSAQETCSTSIVPPALTVSMQGPTEAAVGEVVSYAIQVTNVGSVTLRGLEVEEVFPAGLRERYGATSPIRKQIGGRLPGTLEPGESTQFSLSFEVAAAGEHCHQLTVQAEGGHAVTEERCITAAQQQAAPQVEIRKTGQQQARVGETIEYGLQVRNTGNIALIDVQIADQYAEALRPQHATPGFTPVPGELRWLLQRFEPGQELQLRVQCRCLQADPAALNRALLVGTVEGTNQEVRQTSEVTTAIVDSPGAPAAPPAAAPPTPAPQPTPATQPPATPPASGQLELKANIQGNPIGVGSTTVLVVEVANRRAVSDQNIVLAVRLPDGMEFRQMEGPTESQTVLGGTAIFQPIRVLRPGEALSDRPYRITIRANRAGPFRLRAEVTSQRSPQPQAAEADVTVVAN